MTHFMRNFRRFNRSSLLRSVAIVVAGSTLLCCNKNYDIRASMAAGFPLSLQDYLPSSCPLQNDLFPQHLHFPSISRLFPVNSYRISSPVPSPDITKEYSGAVHDGSKPCGCFGRDSIANAAAKVGPAVVNIVVPQDFHGITAGKGIGSGTIINKDGTILTCAHVVVDFQGTRSSWKRKVCGMSPNHLRATMFWLVSLSSYDEYLVNVEYFSNMCQVHQHVDNFNLNVKPLLRNSVQHVEVTLQDGRTFVGKVLHADQHSDIAIVKINSETPLPEAKLGSSSRLRPGDWVIAMGCPLSLQNTVTAGIVSCVDRKSSDLGFTGMQREYLQTDCAINLGNSGGPLVNIDGEVVGVNIMKVLAADGLGFSVPIDSVCKIIEHFNKSGRVIRPWLGLKMLDLNEMIIAQLKKRDASFPNVDKGILVPMVTPRSPGDRAGFRPGDVVVEFDGKPVESMKEIIEIMGDKVGVPMKVVIKRANDKLVTLTVIPEESNLDI